MLSLKPTHTVPSNPIEINLPASKSVCNRVLLIKKLANDSTPPRNMSTANDSQLLANLLANPQSTYNAEDAGTTYRFMTAYLAATGAKATLTGTHRMKQRPIKILTQALQQLGAHIAYTEKEGYPPLQFNGFAAKGVDSIEVDGSVSSQYISALMMIAPMQPKGLTIILTGKISSVPYIDLTAEIMRRFGAQVTRTENVITIEPKPYVATDYYVEPDWSGASYWFSMVGLAPKLELTLPGLSPNDLQGDKAITEIMQPIGVESEFTIDGLQLKKSTDTLPNSFQYDFSKCPDLAQTVVVYCAFAGIELTAAGLESLAIKETDRTKALQTELSKFGHNFFEVKTGTWQLQPFAKNAPSEKPVQINTYKDHRMAMAFAPVSLIRPLEIENPTVVRKSFPEFWDEFKKTPVQ